MRSVILNFAYSLWCKFCGIFKESLIFSAVMYIYGIFSKAWEKSAVVNFLKGVANENAANGSILSSLIYLPFSILNKIAEALGDRIDAMIKNSCILGFLKSGINAMHALNTRFLGILLLFAGIANAVTGGISKIGLALILAGVVFSVFNQNLTGMLKDSKVVLFLQKIIGFENILWRFYDEHIPAKSFVLAGVLGVLAGVASAKSLILAGALIVGFLGAGTVLVYPITGVFAAVIAAPFVPTMLLAAVCALTFLATFIGALRQKSFKWKIDGIGTGLGFFLVFMLVSSLFSFAVLKSVMVWGMYLIFIGFYFVIINTVESKNQVFAIIKVFVFFGAFVSLYGILQYVFGWNTTNAWIDEKMFEEATMRVYSTMENPNVLGEYLLLLLPLSAVFMLKPKAQKLEKWVYMGIFAISALCMVLTQSRGCWLGLILAAMIFITFYNGKLWGLLPIALLILPFVMPETMVDRMMSVGNMEDSSTSYRVFIWRGTFAMLKDFWIGGIGMGEGAFRSVYPLYSFSGIIAPHSHNTFLQLWVEGGIAALLTFVVIMAAFIKKVSKIYDKKRKNSMESLVSLAAISAVCGFLLQSMFDYTFYNYRMMAMFFMLIALLSALDMAKSKGVEVWR